MRSLLLLVLSVPLVARADFTPAPPETVPGYSATLRPCKATTDTDGRNILRVECADHSLDGKTLRELAILRNTIYARWGWDGYRKPWLRDYFHAQPWFHANPNFGYHLVSDVDKKNAHLIATKEQSFTSSELEHMRNDVYARRGKVWHDVPTWSVRGKDVKSCTEPKGADLGDDGGSLDCDYRKQAWYHADPSFTDAKLSADDKIELGLVSRALGSFALDGIDYDEKGKDGGLDQLMKVGELRQLSMRDLRLMRNTIYARRGRAFKSQILQEHFSGMSWYKVDSAYTDARLTKTDTRNIALIKSVENEFGGPLSDEDWLTDPTSDGA
jgi:hypothetical protein